MASSRQLLRITENEGATLSVFPHVLEKQRSSSMAVMEIGAEGGRARRGKLHRRRRHVGAAQGAPELTSEGTVEHDVPRHLERGGAECAPTLESTQEKVGAALDAPKH
jgi:hypothetical protein